MQFTLDQLRTFDAVARHGSMVGAARELARVPSAVTYLMRELEQELGCALLQRVGRGIVLTPAGVRLLPEVRDVLAQAQRVHQLARDLSHAWEPELRVVVDGALPMAPLTACLQRFAQPDVPTRLRIEVAYQEGVLEQLQQAGCAVALYLGFDHDHQAAPYHCVPLPPLPLVLVVAPSHPLAGLPLSASVQGLHAELVVRDSSQTFARQAQPSYLGSRNVMYLADFHSKRAALLAGAGYGWVPEHLVADDLQAGRLQLVQTDSPRFLYHPQVVSHAARPLGAGGRLFVETLLASVETDVAEAPRALVR